MATLAARHGLRVLVAPVRPTLKHRYPLTSMARYVRSRRPDGAPVDPWLRVHWRLGARILRVTPCSMIMQGRVGDWERWTGLRFPESARYVVPDALAPVTIDRRRHRGRYMEPACGCSTPCRTAGGKPEPLRGSDWLWGHLGGPQWRRGE
jgi:hypothetical protein